MPEPQLPDAERLIDQLAAQIRERLQGDFALIGIHTGGAWVAERLHAALGHPKPIGTLDISFYRDDFSRIGLHPEIKPSSIPFDVDGRAVLLVDDVLYTGRTVRAAMNELFDYGRPGSIELAVLIDRGGRELPIAAQFVGARLELDENQNIQLHRGANGELKLSLHEQR